jgi:sporulation protein YlmC with PRC-barrel domain
MRKSSLFLSMLVLVAVVLTACGGGATSTNVVESPPPVTVDATEDMSGTATESPTEEGTTTETPGVPVTGDVNAARLSNQLDFTVWSQDGEQIGDVEDMVLDLDNTEVAYVVVGTGGFLDLGEREVLVPWDSLQLQTGTGDTTGGQQNAFVLLSDLETFRSAPDFDLTVNLPQMGQSAGDWDVDIRNYWQGGGAGTASTPDAGATADPNATAIPNATAGGANQSTQATATGAATEAPGIATATGGADQGTGATTATAGTGQGSGTDQGQPLQGVMLASEVLNAAVTLGRQGQGAGTGTEQNEATATTDAGSGEATATAEPGTTAEGTATAGTDSAGTDQGTGQGDMTLTIDDMIIDTSEAGESGDILYLVVTSTFEDGERWIPVPVSALQWDATNNGFILNADAAMLQNAPAFQNGQYPDTTTSGWNAEFDTFWQNNSAGGAAEATAAP